MKENKEEEKIVEEGTAVINEKDIINPEEVKQEETIEVEATEVIIEKQDAEQKENASNNEQGASVQDKKPEEVTSTGETTEDMEGESKETPGKPEKEELVAKLNVYYDQLLKMDITEGKVIKEIYEEKGVKLTKKRTEELIAAGVAEIKKV